MSTDFSTRTASFEFGAWHHRPAISSYTPYPRAAAVRWREPGHGDSSTNGGALTSRHHQSAATVPRPVAAVSHFGLRQKTPSISPMHEQSPPWQSCHTSWSGGPTWRLLGVPKWQQSWKATRSRGSPLTILLQPCLHHQFLSAGAGVPSHLPLGENLSKGAVTC